MHTYPFDIRTTNAEHRHQAHIFSARSVEKRNAYIYINTSNMFTHRYAERRSATTDAPDDGKRHVAEGTNGGNQKRKFIYGNYDTYYTYRNPGAGDDPRIKVRMSCCMHVCMYACRYSRCPVGLCFPGDKKL